MPLVCCISVSFHSNVISASDISVYKHWKRGIMSFGISAHLHFTKHWLLKLIYKSKYQNYIKMCVAV